MLSAQRITHIREVLAATTKGKWRSQRIDYFDTEINTSKGEVANIHAGPNDADFLQEARDFTQELLDDHDKLTGLLEEIKKTSGKHDAGRGKCVCELCAIVNKFQAST